MRHKELVWKSLSERQNYSWLGVVAYHTPEGLFAEVEGKTRPVLVTKPAELKRGDVLRGYRLDGRYIATAVQVEAMLDG